MCADKPPGTLMGTGGFEPSDTRSVIRVDVFLIEHHIELTIRQIKLSILHIEFTFKYVAFTLKHLSLT